MSLVKFYLASNDGINASKSMFKVLMNSKIDLKIKHNFVKIKRHTKTKANERCLIKLIEKFKHPTNI